MQVPIDDKLTLAESTPEEAAKNIDNAALFKMDATAYRDMAPELDKEADIVRTPLNADPVVNRYLSQSSEHAALVKPDVEIFDYIARQTKLFGDHIFDRPTNERRIQELRLKEMEDPTSLSEDDQIELEILNEERQKLANRNYGIDGFWEQIPAQVAGQVSEMARGIYKNADLIAWGTGVGLAAGSVIPGPGTIAGAVTGFGVGFSTAFFKDAYERTTGSLYNELSVMTGEDGQPLNIDRETKANISRGVGIVSGALEVVVGRTIMKTTPFLTKYLSPQQFAKFVVHPSNAALRKTLANIAETAVVEGGVEGVQEVAQVLGEEMGRTYDGTEASLINAITSVAQNRKAELGARVGQAMVLGAATGGTIAATTGAAGYKSTKKQYPSKGELSFEPVQTRAQQLTFTPMEEAQNDATRQSVKALEMEEFLTRLSKAAKATKMATVAPEQLADFYKAGFAESGIRTFYVSKEDLRIWANTPEKAEKARQLMNPSGALAGSMNASIGFEPHNLMKLAEEDNALFELAKLEPQAPNPKQAKGFLEKMKADKEQRQQVLTKLPSTAPTEQDAKAVEQALNPVKAVGDVAPIDWDGDRILMNQEDYENQPTFTDVIKQALPNAEVEKINDAQYNARRSVSEAINDDIEAKRLKLVDINFKESVRAQWAVEQERINNDPNIMLVEKFKTHRIGDSKGNKSKSMYAIDPTLLPKELEYYLDNPRLKKHKVFVKGGHSPDEAARLIGGVKDGAELLKILSRTEDAATVKKARMKAIMPTLEERADNLTEADEDARTLAYNKSTRNVIREMEFMRDQEWPATKAGIKRIALPPPKMRDLENKARSAVAQTKVGDLNIQQFKVGERASLRMSLDDILNNRVEKAFMNMEARALNIQFQKETEIAFNRVNKARRFFNRLDTPKNIRLLKKAGPLYENAYNEIIDVFNLVPSRKGTSDRDSFAKFVQAEVEAGNGDFSIPDSMSDIRESADELTVEQTLLLEDRLRVLLHLARLKNKLHTKFKKQNELQTVEAKRKQVVENSILHPDFDPKREYSIQTAETKEETGQGLATAASTLDAFKHIALTLDQEKTNGFFYKNFVEPITGEGEFKNKQGYSGVVEDQIAVAKYLKEQIVKLGDKEYKRLQNTIIDIPEFKDLKGFNYGRLRKGDLMILAGQLGDPDGRENLLKMGAPLEKIQAVIDRELDEKHADFIDAWMHRGPETYRERIKVLEKETTDRDVKFIEGIEWTHRGKTRRGGRMRQWYRPDFTAKQIEASLQVYEDARSAEDGSKINKVFVNPAVREGTDQGYLTARQGSNDPLDLDFYQVMRTYEETIHDLNYRRPTLDALKLLKDPIIKAHIIKTIGQKKYGVMISSVIEVANKMEAENKNYFSDQTRFFKTLVGSGRSSVSLALLGANLTSVMIQPVALVNAIGKMGPVNGTKHMLGVLKMFLKNPHLVRGFMDIAAQLDTSIRSGREGVSDAIVSTFHDLMPSRNLHPKLALPARAKKMINDGLMHSFKVLDGFTKNLVTLSAYNQFRAGDVDGYSLAVLSKMTDKEIHQLASSHAATIAETTLTRSTDLDKSPFQKDPRMELASMFFNDLRQIWNSQLSMGRKLKWKSKAAYKQYKAGDFKNASKSARGAAADVATIFVVASLTKAYMDILYGADDSPWEEDIDWSNPDSMAEGAKRYLGWAITAPVEVPLSAIPLVKEIGWAANNPWNRKEKKQVTFPANRLLSDVATAYRGMADIISLDQEELSDEQFKAAIFSGSYVLGLGGANAGFKLMRWIEDNEKPTVTGPGAVEDLRDQIKKYKENPPKGASKEALEELDALDKKLAPLDASVPPEAETLFKYAASGNDWSKVDPNSTAAGVYQFTEDAWTEIMLEAPDLGLTEEGRYSEDTLEQELALEWLNERNARQMLDEDIPVSLESLYGAHLLGLENYIKVHKAPADTKLKTVIGASERFSQIKTVGAIKKMINEQVEKGRKALTSTAGNSED